jgi:signal transduction histidine kinase
MKTPGKIIAMAGFGLLLIVLFEGFSLRDVIRSFSALITETEQASLQRQQVEAMSQELAVMSVNMHEFIASKDGAFREAADVSRAAVHRMLDAFNAQVLDADDRRISRLLHASFSSMEKTADRLFSLKDPVGRDRVSANSLALETRGLVASMHKDIEAYQKGRGDAQTSKLSDHFRSMKTRVVLLFITILLASAGVLLVFAIAIHRAAAVPLSRQPEGAREPRTGNPRGLSDIAHYPANLNGAADALNGSYAEMKQPGDKAGQMGLAIRHEINNPLTTIIGNVELLIERYEHKDKELTARLETILNNGLRIAEITRRPHATKKETSEDHRTGVDMTD